MYDQMVCLSEVRSLIVSAISLLIKIMCSIDGRLTVISGLNHGGAKTR